MAIAGRKIKEHREEMKHSELVLEFPKEREELLDINSVKRRLKYVKKLVEMERNL